MEHEQAMMKDIRSLDSDMQTLVYENYNKFISATDTIRKVGNFFTFLLHVCWYKSFIDSQSRRHVLSWKQNKQTNNSNKLNKDGPGEWLCIYNFMLIILKFVSFVDVVDI